ncbi:MAG: tRNA (adenosine(37)-N6)-threonylcarbamoyltransferase complex ATPase subunit type 1 TsaE [Ginsengibacter sp.]
MDIVFRLAEIASAAEKFLAYSLGYKIFTFNGELGAGKTTLINAVCKAMSLSERVTSPTYSLVQEYETKDKQTIYHMDFYRLNSLEEAIDAGVEEYISSGEYCMIEWPSKIEQLLPDEIVKSGIFILNDNRRKLVVQLPQ